MAPTRMRRGHFFQKNRARHVCRARSESRKPSPKNKNRAPPRWAGRWGTLHLAAQGCANACHPARWREFRYTSRKTLQRRTAQPCHEDSTPRLNPLPSGAGSVPASHSQPDLTDIKAHAGAAFLRECRVSHRSIRTSSTPASLACRESWQGHGLRLGLHGCNRLAQTISLALCAFLAQQILWASRSSTLLRPLRGAARPTLTLGSPTRTRWARSCNPERKLHHG